MELSLKSTQKRQLVQDVAAGALNRVGFSDHVTPVLFHLYWLLVCGQTQFKVLVITFTAQSYQPSYQPTVLNDPGTLQMLCYVGSNACY